MIPFLRRNRAPVAEILIVDGYLEVRVGGGTLSRSPLASRHSLGHKRKTEIPKLILISRMPGMHPFIVDPVWAVGRSKRK
jgi:hypothetical protein